jgi:hypothetical protein
LAVAFAGSATTIMLTAWVARRLDWLWVAVRRGAGRNPKGGLLEPAMVLGTALVVVGFAFWFLVIEGPGPSIAPRIG